MRILDMCYSQKADRVSFLARNETTGLVGGERDEMLVGRCRSLIMIHVCVIDKG